MMRLAFVLSLAAALAACTKKKEEGTAGSATTTVTTTTTTTTGSGSGSDTGSDTGSAGSAGSAGSDTMAGSGSDAGSAMGSTGSGSAADAGSAAASGVDFDDLSHEEQIKFMKTKVMPPMKTAFQKFDSKAFANFGCKTCHGKDPQKAKYKMPSKDIPALDFDALKKGDDKEIAEFMAKTVKPEMAKILNQPEMTEQNKSGFGCLACHTVKKKKG